MSVTTAFKALQVTSEYFSVFFAFNFAAVNNSTAAINSLVTLHVFNS